MDVCHVFGGSDNAHLIAAAPDMLAALKALVAVVGPMKATRETLEPYEAGKSAIAKAEGRT